MISIAVEFYPTNPPRPICFGVKQDGKYLAALTYDEVKKAMEKFDEMKEGWDRFMEKTGR